MNTKKDRVLFCREVKQILTENGFESFNDSVLLGYNTYQKKTAKNKLKITLRGESDQKHIYSVFCILDTPSRTLGNTYSGKVNFYSSGNVLEAIADFEDHLKQIIELEL